MIAPAGLIAERQVFIAAEKTQKIEQLHRVLKQMFASYGEVNIDWHQATTFNEAIEQIKAVLANLKDIKDAIEIVVVLTGFQGQWFEITGELKLIEDANKKAGKDHITLKALMVSANPMDIQQAQREGVSVINSMIGEEAMAAFAAQILLGESFESSPVGGDEDPGPAYEDYSQDQGIQPWDREEFP